MTAPGIGQGREAWGACKTCRFWAVDPGKRVSRPGSPWIKADKLQHEYAGLCRRYPAAINKWPESFCGEYQRRED